MRRGFALIELLAVTAIIAIRAAILFPMFARAQEKGITRTGSRQGYVIAYCGLNFPGLKHNMMADIGFVDGHAKACTYGFLSQSVNWDRN